MIWEQLEEFIHIGGHEKLLNADQIGIMALEYVREVLKLSRIGDESFSSNKRHNIEIRSKPWRRVRHGSTSFLNKSQTGQSMLKHPI